jgi:hypothetical protein
MTIRSNLLVLLAAAAIFASVAVRAESSVVSIEHGIEASTDTLLMPSSTSGSVTLTCATCNAKSWRLTNQTKLLIGERAVTLQEFTSYIQGTKYNATIFVAVGEPVVTRIRVSPPPVRK